VKTDVLADGVYAAAASGEGEYAVCVAQYRGSWKTYSLCVCGLCENEVYTAESYITDDKRNFELVRVQTGTPAEIDFSQYLKSGSIFVMKLKKAEKQAF
jgi:hypothetical protein